MINYEKALKLYTESGYEQGVANCLNSMAVTYQEQGNYPLALKYHNKSLSLAEKNKDSIGIARSFHNIPAIYKR